MAKRKLSGMKLVLDGAFVTEAVRQRVLNIMPLGTKIESIGIGPEVVSAFGGSKGVQAVVTLK